MLIATIILSVATLIFGFTTWNLLRKIEKQEDILAGYLDYLDKLSRVIEVADKKLKQLDARGSFEADDEIGFFFQQVKQLQEIFNDFIVKKIK